MTARFMPEEADGKSLAHLENFTTVREGIRSLGKRAMTAAGGSASKGTTTPLRTQGQERLSERAAKPN